MNSSQLSLFNTNTATGNVYRTGDWVKVRKKPAIAAWVKRGEVFQINQIHPIDGSLKFWNPHIKQWDFLYPEEVKLTVEPVVGETSKLTVEPVVGEASNGWLESHYKIRVNRKQHSIKHLEIGCTGPYYSYRWMEGKRQRAKYCPASKYPAVRKALSVGQPVNEILKIISSQ